MDLSKLENERLTNNKSRLIIPYKWLYRFKTQNLDHTSMKFKILDIGGFLLTKTK